MKIEIKGIVETSMLDWDGKIVTTLFVSRCNFRCPFCQNKDLVLCPEHYRTLPMRKIKKHLLRYKNWMDGVCLTGGEPCIYGKMSGFIRQIRSTGVKVKLDTNGSKPEVLSRLLKMKLVDYIAMDIKAPVEDSLKLKAESSKLEQTKYDQAAGVKVDLKKIRKSIDIIMRSGIEYEFRTTVVPLLHSAEDIESIAKHIKGAMKYCLQNFNNKDTMDPLFKSVIPYKPAQLEEIKKLAVPFVKECVLRGI